MSSFRHIKWLLFFMLTIFLFMCGFYHISKKTPTALHRRKWNCETGSCFSVPVIDSKPKTSKSTKSIKTEIKKNYKDSYLEKIHILPKENSVQEILYDPKYSKVQRKLLIISYFDWGPPHIGDILNQYPGIFYFNEPLSSFDSTILKDGEEPVSRRLVAEATGYLEDLFDCKILSSRMGYSNDMIKKMAKRIYADCSRSGGNVSECVESSCNSSRIILSKTIRLYVQDVRSFLVKNKQVSKVIILQRDPRVNLNLRNKKMKPGWTAGSDVFYQGRSLCSRMLHDVQEAKRLEGSGFKDFYRIILFEHFLKSPETILKGLFSFIGVSLGEKDMKRLLKQSGVHNQIKKVMLNKWNWISDEVSLQVDKACKFFYKNSLYNPLKMSHGFLRRYDLCKYCDYLVDNGEYFNV